jgi:hypothetical protein
LVEKLGIFETEPGNTALRIVASRFVVGDPQGGFGILAPEGSAIGVTGGGKCINVC